MWSSSSPMRVMNHNWSAMKQRLHRVVKNYDNMSSRFHRIPKRNGQTDRLTNRFAVSISRVSMLSADAR